MEKFEETLNQLENDLKLQIKMARKKLEAIETLRIPYSEPKKVRKPRIDANPDGPTAVLRKMFQSYLNIKLSLNWIENYLRDQVKKKNCVSKTQCVKTLTFLTLKKLINQGFIKRVKIGEIYKYIHDSESHKKYQSFIN